MKKLIAFFMIAASSVHAQSLLVRTDSIKLLQASIWGGISFNGENISITTILFQDRPHLFLRKLDTTLQQVGTLIQLTSNADPVTAKHITDHKHLFLKGFHYITFSVAGDSDLYILKVDKNGNRASNIVPVVEHTSDRTNDMMFTTDGTLLYPDGTTHIDIGVFDENLSLLEQQHRAAGFRPHFLLLGSTLYSVYDNGGVFLERYRLENTTPVSTHPIAWKQYFTLAPEEGVDFTVDSSAIVPGGGVPVVNVTNNGKLILTSAGGPQIRAFEVSGDGRIYTPVTFSQRGPDGGFVYLQDGRTRFLGEEPAPDNTQQRHKSRIVSWISADGMQWIRESGIRYQPGIEDDSIASVASVIQANDSLWRMYYVADWYRTNGVRAAISKDGGVTWQLETRANILRDGDVDPHPVYLSDGRTRLYFRAGMGRSPEQAGIGYCDSEDGVKFDTSKVRLLISDSAVPAMFKLDPAVIKLPNGQVVCYTGAAPFFGQSTFPKLIAAWGRKAVVQVKEKEENLTVFELSQNFPNPFNPATSICFKLPAPSGVEGSEVSPVMLKVFDVLGREVATLVNDVRPAGTYTVRWEASSLPSGVYFYRIQVGDFYQTRRLILLK